MNDSELNKSSASGDAIVDRSKVEKPVRLKPTVKVIGAQALTEPIDVTNIEDSETNEGPLSPVGYESQEAVKIVAMINNALNAGRKVVEEEDFPHLFANEEVVEEETFHHLVDRYTYVLPNSDRHRLHRDINVILKTL